MPEPAKISLREELIFLLNHAAELEHSLCCSYLFTAWSLKDRLEDGLTPQQLEAINRWRKVFDEIAIDEMMHLAVVNSLLVSVGAAPHLDRPNFPHDCAYYMPDLLIELRPFSPVAMQHFIGVEQPTGADLPFPITPDGIRRVEGAMVNEIGPDPHILESQGDIYGIVANGVRTMVGRMGEENVFIGPKPRPAVVRFFESCGWDPASDLDSTIKQVVKIVEQGEGASGDNPDCHYAKFQHILDEYAALKEKDPSFEPAFPVVANPFVRTPPEAQGEVNLISEDFAVAVSDLFNEAYGVLLHLLGRLFALTDETDAEANTLVEAAIGVMAEVLEPLGKLLMRLPAGPEHPGMTAGPSFVVRTMHTLPYKEPAWRLLKERFGELAKHAAELAAEGDHARPIRAVQQSLKMYGSMLG